MSQSKEIEDRYFKECNVVMLPTEDLTYIRYNKSLNIISPSISDYGVKANNYISCQHLYITSDDEIKEGDWFIGDSEKSIKKAKYDLAMDDTIAKIIATTNKALTKPGTLNINRRLNYNLPQPSQSFIKKYCELGGIDKMLVEYENLYVGAIYGDDGFYDKQYELHLKVDSHNTITIKPVKNSWTREEVIDLLKQYQEDFCNFESIKQGLKELKNTINLPEYWKDWINKNL